MTVKELKKELEQYPETMDVFLAERKSDFTYGLVNSVSSKRINFSEDPGGEVLSFDTVVVLDEDY